jgi:ABC-type transporter Mla maintaining outer membrane lipid asymmetry ATPase subunit MlaF
VLSGVDWRVCAGDFWLIGGLARSGKTNLLLAAAGVLRPASGTVRLFGQSFSGEGDVAMRLKVGLVFDGGQLLQHLTLAENVALPLDYHAADDEDEPSDEQRLAGLVEFTGLARWAAARPSEVNRNWQQRYGLARALALDPEVLLLDNPLSGLDPRDTGWWMETLDALATGHPIVGGRPLTLVVTGDDLRPWRQRARQFAVVRDGTFIEVGGRTDLERHPEPLLRELLPAARPSE